jgi:hypothetical protein
MYFSEGSNFIQQIIYSEGSNLLHLGSKIMLASAFLSIQ